MARKTMAAGIVNYDEAQGLARRAEQARYGGRLGVITRRRQIAVGHLAPGAWPWCSRTSDQSARIGFQPARELGGAISKERQTGIITLDGVKWPRATAGPAKGRTPTSVSQVLSPGDVIYADPLFKDGNPVEGQYRLRQLPEVSGAMVVMDPWTGPRSGDGRRLLVRPEPVQPCDAGLSAAGFRRSSRSCIRPRSTMVIRPSTVVVDAPIEIDQGQGRGVWRPRQFSNGKYQGADHAAERAALVVEYGDRAFGAGHRHAADQRICPPRFWRLRRIAELSVLCARCRETTVMRMVTAIFDVRQWRPPRKADPESIAYRIATATPSSSTTPANAVAATLPSAGRTSPSRNIVDRREQVLDTMTAYQITSMLEGRGPGGVPRRRQGSRQAIAGKTGTPTRRKMPGLSAFSPDIVVGIYLGFDKPRPPRQGQCLRPVAIWPHRSHAIS